MRFLVEPPHLSALWHAASVSPCVMRRCTLERMTKRAVAMIAVGLAACGRIGFDPETADEAEVLRDCALLLHMDEPGWNGTPGEVADACGQPNNGKALLASTIDDDKRGTVGSFPVGACIEIPDAPELDASTAVTMSAWIFARDANAGAAGVISKRFAHQNEPAYTMFITNGALTIDIADDTIRASSRPLLESERWTQITVVYDGTAATDDRIRIYSDGLRAVSMPEVDTAIAPGSSPLYIACLPNAPAPLGMFETFEGRLDDVAVWTRALTDREIDAWHELTR